MPFDTAPTKVEASHVAIGESIWHHLRLIANNGSTISVLVYTPASTIAINTRSYVQASCKNTIYPMPNPL